jgi:formyl-CoA transferase
VPTLVADKTAGMAVVNAVLAALLHRERTGKGQYVEVPMLETVVAYLLTEHLGGDVFEPPLGPPGYARLLEDGRKPAPTADGHIAMLPYTGKHWRAFFDAAGRPELGEELASDDRGKRNANNAKLYAAVREITVQRTTAEWVKICEERDIPATPFYGLDQLQTHPQLEAVALFQTMEHPSEGTLRYVRPPTKFSGSPASVRRAAPGHGEHSVEILREAGFADDEIARLREAKIVHQKD